MVILLDNVELILIVIVFVFFYLVIFEIEMLFDGIKLIFGIGLWIFLIKFGFIILFGKSFIIWYLYFLVIMIFVVVV